MRPEGQSFVLNKRKFKFDCQYIITRIRNAMQHLPSQSKTIVSSSVQAGLAACVLINKEIQN